MQECVREEEEEEEEEEKFHHAIHRSSDSNKGKSPASGLAKESRVHFDISHNMTKERENAPNMQDRRCYDRAVNMYKFTKAIS